MGLIPGGIRPTWAVIANQQDITASIADRLISLSITDEVGMDSDLLEITLADTEPGAPIAIPPTGAELEVLIGYDGANTPMGLFICDEVEVSGWPGEMVIRARAAVYSQSKGGKTDLQTQKTRSWAAGTTLGVLVETIAQEHGLDPAISEALRSITLPHTDQADESDINLLLRLAKRYDALVKPAAGKLVMAKRGESRSVSGEPIQPVAIHSSDCSTWRMLLAKREAAGTVVAYWHEVTNSKRNEVKAGSGEPVRRLRQYYPDEDAALAAAKAELARRQRGQETVSLTCVGAPWIAAEAPLQLSGFRPGVDGGWLISRVTHHLTPRGGYTCDIEAEKPDAEEEPEISIESE